MSGVQIKKRTVKTKSPRTNRAERFYVYYRRGGRTFKQQYAGSFETKAEAKTRADLIAGELAAGRDPRTLLASLLHPASRVGLLQRWLEFEASRIDVGESALGLYRNARARWVPILGEKTDPAAVTVEQIQAGVIDDLADLKPNTIVHYTSTLRQVLDFCDVVPNPASARKLRLPVQEKQELAPPTNQEWTLIHKHVRARSLLALDMIEALGLRISECVNLEYGDLDFSEGNIRIARSRTKTSSGRRWLAVPDVLLERIAATCPPEDRLRRRHIFKGLSTDMVRYDLRCACMNAGVSAHGPHDLRHRRISLWIRLGFDAVTVQSWAGHAKASMSLDTYGHVVLDARGDVWADFWRSVYDKTREGRVEVET